MNNMNGSNLGEIITELIETRGFSLEKLTEATNINKRYLAALLANDFKALPAAPYVRGYLSKIAEVMEADPEELQNAYARLELRTSGKNDLLPGNKFVIVKSKKGILTILVVLAVIVSFIIHWSIASRTPEITVNIPEKIENQDYLTVGDMAFVIEGQADKKDTVFINSEPIPVDYKGFFSKEISLNDGINTFEIRVQRFLGKETTITRKIFYTAPLIVEPAIDETNPEETSADKTDASDKSKDSSKDSTENNNSSADSSVEQ